MIEVLRRAQVHRASTLGTWAVLCWTIALAFAAPCRAQEPGPPAPFTSDPVVTAQDNALREAIIGLWEARIGSERLRLQLSRDGTFTLAAESGTFAVENSRLILETTNGRTAYQVALADQQLTLTGGGVAQPLVFTRDPILPRHRIWLFDIAPAELWFRVRRILIIVLFTAITLMVIAALRAISRAVILADRGPLAKIYGKHKHRALTLHSLTLNIIKYIVYFTAFGMILNAMGVNYMAYLASLSVIGLAVGFGSQGLVQDMVTGFFVIFEGQYDVDDMVEISGQVGIVQELGIRMTRLRNYQGQTVVIPNRNIAVVGNFFKGAQHAHVDGSVRREQAPEARRIIESVAAEVADQYRGVILSAMRIAEPVHLPSGETYVRLSTRIWPQQQWVIEQQLVPRLREALKRQEIEILGDRIVPFYKSREQVVMPTWRERLPWRRRRKTNAAAP